MGTVANWIVRSKLNPSVPLHELVRREPLLTRLDGVLNARAAIVHAPAGYGKSTLLAQWHSTLKRRGIPVAWLALDDYDTDPFQFLAYIMEACMEGGFCTAFDFPDSLQSFSGSPHLAYRAAMLTILGKCQGPHVLILDDFHRANVGEVRDVVNVLLTDLPEEFRIVVSTREYPASLSLADLRVRGALVEITQSNLQFSDTDIQSYLGGVLDPAESNDWLEELSRRTEGWPIALQTVRRWIKEGATLEETLRRVSGRSSDLVDYFLEQVFDKLEGPEREFLLHTCILERVNGELGDALCGSGGSWEMLERLERRELFVNSVDHERTWFRYHPLFSEFLRERLRRHSDALLRDLHSRAVAWFRKQGHQSEAVQHALSSRNPDLLADLLESLGGWHYALQGHIGIVERVLNITPIDLVQKNPRLWLAHIFMLVRRGDLENAEREFTLFAERYLEDSSTDAVLQCEGRMMECLLGRYADRDISEQEIRQLEALSQRFPHDNHVMNAVCYNLLCAMHARFGRLEASIAAGDQAIMHFRRVGSIWGEVFIYFHEGSACMARARLRDAEALFREGFNLAVEHFGTDSDSAAIGRAFLAEVAYEKNNLHEAGRLLDEALPHIERFDAWFDVYLAAYSTAMKLARQRRDGTALIDLTRRAKSTAANRRLPRLSRAIDACRLGFDQHDRILQHDSVPAGDSTQPGVERDTADPVMRHLSSCIAARGYLLAGEFDKAVVLLEAEAEHAREHTLIRSFITLSLLLATARWKQGRHEAAIAAFEAALAPALFEGLKRPFIDEGDLLAGVVRELTTASEQRRGNRLRDVFLTELTAEMDKAGAGPRDDGSQLSPRERQVLRYLIQGRSNREIAAAMGLSINTIKFHIKNIFGKLGVSSRKDAVSATIRQHLLH
jgi:LuxR family maltose regulon positive regulatory protein